MICNNNTVTAFGLLDRGLQVRLNNEVSFPLHKSHWRKWRWCLWLRMVPLRLVVRWVLRPSRPSRFQQLWWYCDLTQAIFAGDLCSPLLQERWTCALPIWVTMPCGSLSSDRGAKPTIKVSTQPGWGIFSLVLSDGELIIQISPEVYIYSKIPPEMSLSRSACARDCRRRKGLALKREGISCWNKVGYLLW